MNNMDKMAVLILVLLVLSIIIQMYFAEKEELRRRERHLLFTAIVSQQERTLSAVEKAAIVYVNEHTWEPYKEVDSDDEE